MSIEHKVITDGNGSTTSQRHEPKGISIATADTVYVADGAGSGSWATKFTNVYGEMYIAANTTTFTTNATADTYDQLINTGWAEGESSSNITITADDVNDDIDIADAGTYLVSFWCNLDTSATANTTFSFKYALDGTVNTRKVTASKYSASGSDILNVTAIGIVTVTAGQDLSIHIASSATSQTITITDGGLSVVRLA